ncbi:hypothetical protein [Nostoc sp. ATCC 53789]|uniref:hypothetical protein n=1 Tax=Nostoc sp. ATCC 53789 TaxID=76335 RepID=UPI000DECAA00|nr:hypothetical protein [Nostoc sp. ATCC 53789]QHG21021.1 hypothetical protein GJB62_34755 [Nostoc sp. ATCC 53789]RCJ16775.1 hypothetical protein A6V25_30350 [Nostoc sp. ATCC 53789]
MSSSSIVIINPQKCRPFLLKVMVYSPEAGYKFIIEIQKACTANNEEVWKLLFDLYKKIDNNFVEIISVEYVAGDPNEIEKVAAITDEGMKRSQVREFRENVYPVVKTIAVKGETPTTEDQKNANLVIKNAVLA